MRLQSSQVLELSKLEGLGFDRSPAADSDSLAPSRIPALLALEVQTWTALPRNIRELIAQVAKENPNWGQRPRRFRTVCEARDPGLATYSAGLLALGT